jgi:hypothetical protein
MKTEKITVCVHHVPSQWLTESFSVISACVILKKLYKHNNINLILLTL